MKPFDPEKEIYDIPDTLSLTVEREDLTAKESRSVCCNAPLIGGVQCENCGADRLESTINQTPKKGTVRVEKQDESKI